MPQISSFLGIIIRMFYRDHNPPHFHASYAEHNCLIDIQKLEVLSGLMPPRVLGLIIEWASMHKTELLDNCNKAIKQEPLQSIQPLV
jgi:hypothetical protein